MPKLVVHVPHASITIPDDLWQEFFAAPDQVMLEAQTSADLFTDIMARQAWPEAIIIEAVVSRIVVDVERYADDALEDMAKVGRGAIYTHDHQHQRIRRNVSESRKLELLAAHYSPHWSKLKAAATGATLIDLHTYPKAPWPVERHADGPRPEIDIGFADGLAPPEWIEALARHFGEAGYEVGHNTPYAGVIDAGANAAVMIEIRRDVVGTPGTDPLWRRLVSVLGAMPVL